MLTMENLFPEKKLIVATHNPGKLVEFETMLAFPGKIALLGAGDMGLPEPDETGSNFAANARLKATAAMKAAGLPALADDSGLAVEALNGDPGIYSARWAGPEKNFATAMEKIRVKLAEKQLGTSPAAFVAALCLALPDGQIFEVEGRVEGHLEFPPRGENGFGYDPIFVPEGETRTFGEMPPDEKDRLSHRARAVAKLREKIGLS
jgi:XTP/dITP diphosphohydrolase